jgi:rRNA maturation endonuclease Nob1
MSEVIRDAQHDFWRPPVVQHAAGPVMVEVCDGCGTEFMVGARFCHVCGSARQAQATAVRGSSWMRVLEILGVFEFQNVRRWLGLSMASLVAFFVGLGCLLAVVAVGVVYSVQNLADFQALQSYRMQWLLAAVAAFVAGILLKKTPDSRE